MKALKFVRVGVALGVFSLVTLFFLGLGGGCGLLEKVQLVPAILGCAGIPLVLWFVVTILFGRLYCSMVCPLGILQDVLGRLMRPFGRRSFTPGPNHWVLRIAMMVLFVGLFFAGGTALAGLVDPYSLFGRIASSLLQPAAEWCNNLLADQLGVEGAIVLFKREIVMRSVAGLTVAASALGMLVLLVAWKGRLFCNTLCPVGALFAAISKRPAFGIRIDREKCVSCGRCSGVCKALCLDGKRQRVDNARCVRCFNCLGACAKGALSFGFLWKGAAAPEGGAARGGARRLGLEGAAGLAAGVAGGAAAVGVFGVKPKREKPGVLLPPGAAWEAFWRKCTACGLCVAKCPRKVLVPAGFSEYGVLGFMMPKMVFTHGFCDPACTRCGEVCPSGALRPLDALMKKKAKPGLATFDRAACLACTEKLPCGLCERRCPEKAITLKEEDVPDGDKKKKVQVPVIDEAKCIGCGACENYCPAHAMQVRVRKPASKV